MALRTKDAGEYTYGQTMSQFPSQQALIRVVTDLGPRCDASMQFRWVAAMPGVPSYRTADARVAFHPFARLDLSLVGRNLLAPAHIEQTPVPLAPTAAVPRSVHVRVDWRF
jgi:hypothetical protein